MDTKHWIPDRITFAAELIRRLRPQCEVSQTVPEGLALWIDELNAVSFNLHELPREHLGWRWQPVGNIDLVLKGLARVMATLISPTGREARALNELANRNPSMYRTRGLDHTLDFCTQRIPELSRLLDRFEHKSFLKVLYLGANEGLIPEFLLSLRPEASMQVTCVSGNDALDTSELLLQKNLRRSPTRTNVIVWGRRPDYSYSAFRMNAEHFDVAFVDGTSRPRDLCSELDVAWDKLLPEGCLFVDSVDRNLSPIDKILLGKNYTELVRAWAETNGISLKSEVPGTYIVATKEIVLAKKFSHSSSG